MPEDDPQQKNIPPPPELSLGFMCQRWHALPSEILSQPIGLMDRMSIVLDTYYAVRGYTLAQDTAAWANANPGLFTMWQKIENLKNERH